MHTIRSEMNLATLAVAAIMGLTATPADGQSYYCNAPDRRDCTGNGNADNPEEGEHYCHPYASCQDERPFVDEEEERRLDCGEGKDCADRGQRSGPCSSRQQNCPEGRRPPNR